MNDFRKGFQSVSGRMLNQKKAAGRKYPTLDITQPSNHLYLGLGHDEEVIAINEVIYDRNDDTYYGSWQNGTEQ